MRQLFHQEHYRSVLVAGCAHSRDVPVRKIVPLTPFKHYVLKTHVATINYRAAEPTHVNRGRDDSEPKAKAGRPLVPRRRKSYMTVSSPMQCQSFEELQSIASVFYVYRDGEEVNEVPRTVRIIWMVWYSLKELLGTYYPGGKVVARKYQLPDKEDWTHR